MKFSFAVLDTHTGDVLEDAILEMTLDGKLRAVGLPITPNPDSPPCFDEEPYIFYDNKDGRYSLSMIKHENH